MVTSSSSLFHSRVMVGSTQLVDQGSATAQTADRKDLKPPYQLALQVKFLHLAAEVESLLQQLQSIKQQRQSSS